ncbi:MAG TPA: hypothetical protein ENJ91_08040 [Rhodobacteraceae bacterium]|nr:hypothetical protein [Paracoccaceae bacterium]
MMHRKLVFAAGIATALLTLKILPGVITEVEAENMQSKQTDSSNTIAPVNERFDSLRDYLSWQNEMHERVADFPWYEEIAPGRFRFHGSRGQRPDKHVYSEDDLRAKLGFAR